MLLLSKLWKRAGRRPLYGSAAHSIFYLLDRQAEVYLDLMRCSSYGRVFHATIRKLIDQRSGSIISGLRAPLDLIDLGPGYPGKTFPILQHMRSAIRRTLHTA